MRSLGTYCCGIVLMISALLGLLGLFELNSLAHFEYRLSYDEGAAFSRKYLLTFASFVGGMFCGGAGLILLQKRNEGASMRLPARLSVGVSIVGLTIAFTSPGQMAVHSVASAFNICINNQRAFEAAKSKWERKNDATNRTDVTWDDISPYFTNGFPKCPKGGTYTLGRAGEPVLCSIPGHRLPP